MPTLDDIYGGILKPGPQGGIYEPGPEVVFPTQNTGTIARVTPEGLNVYQRPVVAIDSAGNPILAQPAPIMRAAQSGAQKTTGGMAGTVQLPAGTRPSAVDQAFAEIERQKAAEAQPTVADSMGRYNPSVPTYNSTARSERPPIDRTESAFLDAFYPDRTNLAVAAIENAAPTHTVRMPLMRPLALMRSAMPLVPADGMDAPPVPRAPVMRAAAPVRAAPAPVMRPAIGYNGKTTATSAELRPVTSSIFSENALLPPAMNTRRWLGDGY